MLYHLSPTTSHHTLWSAVFLTLPVDPGNVFLPWKVFVSCLCHFIVFFNMWFSENRDLRVTSDFLLTHSKLISSPLAEARAQDRRCWIPTQSDPYQSTCLALAQWGEAQQCRTRVSDSLQHPSFPFTPISQANLSKFIIFLDLHLINWNNKNNKKKTLPAKKTENPRKD